MNVTIRQGRAVVPFSGAVTVPAEWREKLPSFRDGIRHGAQDAGIPRTKRQRKFMDWLSAANPEYYAGYRLGLRLGAKMTVRQAEEVVVRDGIKHILRRKNPKATQHNTATPVLEV